MEQILEELICKTSGEGFTDITPYINNWIKEKKITRGILVISLKHTSCSLIINENADPNVLHDLSSYLKALVPENNFRSLNGEKNSYEYLHSQEGPDDMPAHIKTALTASCLTLSINNNQLVLGTWQAIYLWEHRKAKHNRILGLHAIGEIKTQ